MKQQTEKICFRYDVSDEAKKCIEWINEKFHKGLLRQYEGMIDKIYDNQGCNWKASEPQPPIRLVTPAEFIRLMKGESQWTPKYGEEVEVSDDGEVWHAGYYCCPNPHHETKDEYPHCAMLNGSPSGGAGAYRHIRPIRKSLREEINSIVAQHYNKHHQDITDEIIELIKERRNEL